jgi:hypothetical protein
MRVHILGATAWNKGAHLVLCGKDETSAGSFELASHDGGTNNPKLVGKPDGTLTWNNNKVITSEGGTYTTPVIARQSSSTSYTTVCGGTGTSDGARMVLCSKGDSDVGQFKLYANDGTNSKILVGKPDGTLTWGGTLKATTFQATSDSRLKDNIEPVKYRYALNAINSIDAYSYKLKDDSTEGRRYGVIAQELLEVLPEVVKQDKEGYYSVDYSGLTAICVAAINELTVRVQFLERQLAEITNQKETK